MMDALLVEVRTIRCWKSWNLTRSRSTGCASLRGAQRTHYLRVLLKSVPGAPPTGIRPNHFKDWPRQQIKYSSLRLGFHSILRIDLYALEPKVGGVLAARTAAKRRGG